MYLWRKNATSDWVANRNDELISRFGSALAITERPGKARTMIEVSCSTRQNAVRLQREFGGTIEKLARNWLQQLAKPSQTKPLKIGSRLLVGRTPGPNTIVIPAETAFGTGDHATTAMCLRMLERITRHRAPGWSLLDAGTGTGILAIAGARLGAKRVVAIDNDPLACSVARRNARANGVRRIEFRTGDALKQRLEGKFDIITANLFSEILLAAMPVWLRHLAPAGSLILSGVLRSQERALVTALRRNGFRAAEIRRRGKWIAVLAVRARKRS
jgi:ribosomal protein L11 methyltransferase